jgi:hypothetical protein
MYSGYRPLNAFQVSQPLLHGQYAGAPGDISLEQTQLTIPPIDP